MRPIDIGDVEAAIPKGWQAKADAAKLKVQAAKTPAERAKTIDRCSDVWSGLKEPLKQVSHGKCWYCESRNPRADNAVDHFRPKGHLADERDHGGYWWKAFDWDNYRFSCTYCNSGRKSDTTTGGKQDHFPIKDPAKRAKGPEEHIEDEEPILLDPLNPDDVGLITFDPDGMPVPAKKKETDEDAFRRAEQTIRLYHLDHPETVERRADTMRRAKRMVQKADEYHRQYEEKHEVSAHEAYRDNLREAGRAVRAQAEYSAAARAAIGALRGTSGSAAEIFDKSW